MTMKPWALLWIVAAWRSKRNELLSIEPIKDIGHLRFCHRGLRSATEGGHATTSILTSGLIAGFRLFRQRVYAEKLDL